MRPTRICLVNNSTSPAEYRTTSTLPKLLVSVGRSWALAHYFPVSEFLIGIRSTSLVRMCSMLASLNRDVRSKTITSLILPAVCEGAPSRMAPELPQCAPPPSAHIAAC